MGLATSLLGEGLAEPRSGSGESEHSLDVESGGCEMPLADDSIEAAQQELPKADRRFDDAEDRFGYLLALCVEPFALGRRQALAHDVERRHRLRKLLGRGRRRETGEAQQYRALAGGIPCSFDRLVAHH